MQFKTRFSIVRPAQGGAVSASRRATLRLLAALAVAPSIALLAGCGGGGGGGGGGSTNNTTVTGQVLDSAQADAPLAGAKITIGGVTTTTSTTATATNPVGYFSIQGATVGANTAMITPAGGIAQTVAFSPSVTNGTNTPLQLYINIGQISGKVLLPNGSAAAGAFVSSSVDGNSVTTASDGTFLITNVPTGATTLAIVLGTASATQAVTVGNGVTNVGTITLADSPGQANPPSAPYDIVGKVTLGGSGNGAVAVGAQVFLLSNGTQLEVTTTDANGQYTFYVPVGTYQLQYQANEYQVASQNVTVSNPNTPLTATTVSLTPQ